MFEAIIFVSILFVFLTTFIFWCCEKKRDLDTRIIGGAVIIYCFISVFTQIYLLPMLEIRDWDKRLSLQMQLTALVVGLTAAIIAFRNYQRKSGQDIYCAFHKQITRSLPHVNGIALYNNKDRATVVFAVDLIILGTNDRIRLFQDDLNPIIIPAYSSVVVKLERTSKYTNNYIPDSFAQDKVRVVCITMNGAICAQYADMDMLKIDFQKTCIRPLAISNVPESYKKDVVPFDATHWVVLKESRYVYNVTRDEARMICSDTILTGYFQNDIFYLTPEPEAGSYLKKYLHKKTNKQIKEIKLRDNDKNRKGYFNQDEDIGLMNIEKIKFIRVTKQ